MIEPTDYPDLGALLPRLAGIPTLPADAVEAEHTAILGRKSGILTAALKTLASLPVDERKRYGAAVNRLKARFEAAFAERAEALAAERRRHEAAGVDLTMPGRRQWVGADSGCQKPFDTDDNCTNVKVTLSAPSCKRVGVIISGTIYPADDLPDQYAVDGKNICIQYSFFITMKQNAHAVEEKKCILLLCIDFLYCGNWKKRIARIVKHQLA